MSREDKLRSQRDMLGARCFELELLLAEAQERIAELEAAIKEALTTDP